MIEMGLAIYSLALSVTVITHEERGCMFKKCLVVFYIQKVIGMLFYFTFLEWWGANSSCCSKKTKLFLEIFISATLK